MMPRIITWYIPESLCFRAYLGMTIPLYLIVDLVVS